MYNIAVSRKKIEPPSKRLALDFGPLSVYCRHLMRICDPLAIVGSLQFGLSGPLDCHVYAMRGPTGVVLIDSGAGTRCGGPPRTNWSLGHRAGTVTQHPRVTGDVVFYGGVFGVINAEAPAWRDTDPTLTN